MASIDTRFALTGCTDFPFSRRYIGTAQLQRVQHRYGLQEVRGLHQTVAPLHKR